MQELMMLGGGWVFIALCLNAVLWFFLPFAVFGTKKRLDLLIDLQVKQLVQMRLLTQDIEPSVKTAPLPKKWFRF